jgi:dihydrodipicolinate synthase/N-acetylneuraminate lyase
MLFHETNPGPIKYFLYKKGMIHSPETRLPVIKAKGKIQQYSPIT